MAPKAPEQCISVPLLQCVSPLVTTRKNLPDPMKQAAIGSDLLALQPQPPLGWTPALTRHIVLQLTTHMTASLLGRHVWLCGKSLPRTYLPFMHS
jgi:hypothetical protein